MFRPQPIKPEPGQESVWDYPRPPRLEVCSKRIKVIFNDVIIVDTQKSQRLLETSHPPNYYIPVEDIKMEYFYPVPAQSFCEWKGIANYYTIVVGEKQAVKAAWYYSNPNTDFAAIKNHLAIYSGLMDSCYVNNEIVTPQPGGFYGGWITSDIIGPFKGEPGTWHW